jgi:hypothetical protein
MNANDHTSDLSDRQHSDLTLARVAPTDSELRALVEQERAEWAAQEAYSKQYEPPVNTKCTKCGNLCPSGTLDNGLCLDCDLIGARVYVSNWSTGNCQITRVGKRGTVYAKRLYETGGESKERPIHYYKGWRV